MKCKMKETKSDEQIHTFSVGFPTSTIRSKISVIRSISCFDVNVPRFTIMLKLREVPSTLTSFTDI